MAVKQGEYLFLEWDELYNICVELVEKIKLDGFNPDIILGVARGGWIPARLLSDFLENPNVASIRVEFYTDVGETGKIPRITQPCSLSLAGKKVLIVDDVSDTGMSLKKVKEEAERLKASHIKVATLHYKPKSIFRPDYYIGETDSWIIYPHERFEFIKSKTSKMKENGKDLTYVKMWLESIGFKKPVLQRLVERAWSEGC